jgi:saccharopine dehydrogenase-like NADP-dependent oxidoreductase
MKSIVVLGAGRSSSALINYLLDYAMKHDVEVIVGDVSEEAAKSRIAGHPSGKAILFDITDTESSAATILKADIVVSLLPPHYHPDVAEVCLEHGKHLVTASYVSDDMRALHQQACDQSLIFLNECGLDPGIDHMSAMQVLDRIKSAGHRITTFQSFTGGLIAPETDPGNPWRYKFTWNARNVVMAGQSTAKYLSEGQFKFIPYQQLFQRITPVVVPGYGEFEGYVNRDSLKYINEYSLDDVRTMLRGTLRYKGFCAAWNILVQLGCCEDTYEMENTGGMTHRDFLNCFFDGASSEGIEDKIIRRFSLETDGEQMKRLRWAGLFANDRVGLDKGTPAAILEHILNKKWTMKPNDKDLVVMSHRIGWEEGGTEKFIEASLVVKGEDSVNTAMARTVGLPLGIAAKLILENKIQARGVLIPSSPEFYEPILAELKMLGIELTERDAD